MKVASCGKFNGGFVCFRETFSHPAHAFYVALKVSELRGDATLEDICRITGDNMIRLYRCPGITMAPHSP